MVHKLLPVLALVSLCASAQTDAKGSSDHPLFPNRMPGYTISNYRVQGFAPYTFRMKPPKKLEGRYTRIHYYLNNVNEHPGGLAIHRNYQNAIKAVGGEVVYSDENVSVMRAMREGKEVWAELQMSTTFAGRTYFLNILEMEPMVQVITADAMGAAIDQNGFVPLDIHFDTGKADILPESMPTVEQIVELLKSRPTLMVGVEGHTDNSGNAAANKTLSEDRAKSVVAALVKAGIDAGRLIPAGFGQEMPIADNRLEEGRAKNRRVEIVKK